MLACNLSRFYIAIHSLSMYQLLDEYLAELPTILDHIWHSQYHKHTYRGGRWEWWGAMKWQAKAMYVNTENSQMVSIGAIFNST